MDDGQVWGASGSAVVTLLRFALTFANGRYVERVLEEAIAMNGLGVDLGSVESAEYRDELRNALRKGSVAMRDHLSGLIRLAEELEMMLGPEDD